MRQSIDKSRRNVHILFSYLITAILIQGCVTVKCEDCGDKDKKCGENVVVTCKDKSQPKDGKCADGSNAIVELACMQKPAACGSVCYDWQIGKACDTSNPNARCHTVTNPNGSCECKCS
jgi:hypothetical protein